MGRKENVRIPDFFLKDPLPQPVKSGFNVDFEEVFEETNTEFKIALKHQELIDDFEKRTHGREMDGVEFITFYRGWKADQSRSTIDRQENDIIRNVNLATLKTFVRQRSEGLLKLSRGTDFSDQGINQIKLERERWARIGSTIADAIKVAPQISGRNVE